MTFQILLPETTWKHKTKDALQNYLGMHAVFELATPEMMLPMEIVHRCTSHEIDDVHLLLHTVHSGCVSYV